MTVNVFSQRDSIVHHHNTEHSPEMIDNVN